MNEAKFEILFEDADYKAPDDKADAKAAEDESESNLDAVKAVQLKAAKSRVVRCCASLAVRSPASRKTLMPFRISLRTKSSNHLTTTTCNSFGHSCVAVTYPREPSLVSPC